MNLEKAIKNLTQWHKDLRHDKLPGYYDSLKLGIEALKAYRKAKEAGWYPPGYKLPGEARD